MHGIVVAGHICLDLTPRLGANARIAPGALIDVGPLRVGLGGCTANTGTALADLGEDVSIHATVGDDELGRLVAAKIGEHARLRADLHVHGELATSYSLVVEPAGLDRTFWHHTGANTAFTGARLDVGDADLLHLGYPPLLPGIVADRDAPLTATLRRAHEAGATTSLDLAVVDPDAEVGRLDWAGILRAAMPWTDVVSPSLDDLTSALGTSGMADTSPPALADAYADRLLEWGAAVVAVSSGAEGLLVRTAGADRLRRGGRALAPLADAWADAAVRVSPAPVERVVTTNGAGDAATAGLLYALRRGMTPEHAALVATASAAAIISGLRPTPAALARIRPGLADVLAAHGAEPPVIPGTTA